MISDTHLPRGGRTLPQRCVDLCRGADLVLHCGDVTSRAFWDELLALGPPVAGVRGNMDDPGLWDALPVEREVDVGGARIGMVHIPGSSVGREARLAERFPGCRAVVYGHTHVPQVARHGDVWILNSGSPTERRRAPTHSLLLLTVEGATIRPELVRL